MSIIQINLKDEEPKAPPSAQMELYAPAPEAADDDLHSVPVLLIQLQDELTRSRRREALWLSVITHMMIIAALLFGPKLIPARPVVLVNPADLLNQRELTYIQAPPDRQKVERPRDTNLISDKNRIAMSRHPELNRKELQKILDSSRPGTPGNPGPTAPPAPQVAQATPAPQPQQPPGGGMQAPPSQNPTLQAMQRPPRNVFGNVGNSSAGSLVEQAARAAAAGRGGGDGGDFGLGQPGGGAVRGGLEVLSDTMGVDFGPYLARVLQDVKRNWYTLIPEVARPPLMKKGELAIEFAILKDGRVAGMRLAMESGDTSLDRAAWGGISASNPFPPLPGEYKGDYLALRFHFLYNPDRNMLK